jgi:hypothetical protein
MCHGEAAATPNAALKKPRSVPIPVLASAEIQAKSDVDLLRANHRRQRIDANHPERDRRAYRRCSCLSANAEEIAALISRETDQ